MHRPFIAALAVLFAFSFTALHAETTVADAGSQTPTAATSKTPSASGIVSHIRVVSDKVEDVSSMEAWKKSFIKDGMTDEQKALAIWKTVSAFRHQDTPPDDYLQDGGINDAIKSFNVYGYNLCFNESASIEALARYIGLPARGWMINHHSVPEIFYDKSWHLYDASLLNYFPKADGKIAGVEEIMAGVKDWYDKNPGYLGNDAKLMEFMKGGNWRKGPEILSRCQFYNDNGWLPARTHSWQATMMEYNGTDGGAGKPLLWDYGYAQGYEVNLQLRPGERLIRNWSNKGLFVNMDGGNVPDALNAKAGQGDFAYSATLFGDLAPGRIGNGVHEYNLPLVTGAFKSGALSVDNLACTADDHAAPALHLKDARQPGALVLRMPSSYVYLSGTADVKVTVANGGEVALLISDNNGLDWKDVKRFSVSASEKIDLKPFVFRRYDYRLKVAITGSGSGIDALKLTHDVQQSQRALPALGTGHNTITFGAGPQTGTITVEGSVHPGNAGKQLVFSDFHPELSGVGGDPLQVTGNGKGTITFPVTTPGDMKSLRFGAIYRARDKADGWDYQVSFDGGKSFKTVDHAAGPEASNSKYTVVNEIPAGTRSALVRYSGTSVVATCLFSFRIDADYTEPHGAFHPVKITYVWDENGAEKTNTHIATTEKETYTLDCPTKPAMKSITLELAD